jgi:hypothetical protein
VIKVEALCPHRLIERLFAGVPKWRMPDIVYEREHFDQIGVQVQLPGDGAGYLRDFESMRQTIAKVIGKASGEYLCFIFETAKRARMDDTVAVTLVIVAIGMRRFRIAASARLLDSHSIRGEHVLSLQLSAAGCQLLVGNNENDEYLLRATPF